MGKIRVLYNIGHLSVGGSERQLLEFVKRIDSSKFEIIVCVLSDSHELMPEFEKYCEVIVLSKFLPIDFTRIPRLRRIIRERNVDIVHNDLSTANYWGTIAGKLEKKPVIISFKGDILAIGFYKRMFYKLLCTLADLILVNSKFCKDILTDRIGAPGGRIEVVYNGLDPSQYEIKPKTSGSGATIGIIGRLSSEKNHELFLKAASILTLKYPNLSFVIAGEGSRKEYLIKLCQDMGLSERVSFLGLVNPWEFYELVDVVALTSLHESFPNVLMEAMAAGKPVVATDVGGVNELVTNGAEGFLVESGNAPLFAEKLESLVNDPDLRKAVGEKGLKKIREFNISKKVDRTQEIYINLKNR